MLAALAIAACTDSGGDKSGQAFPTQPSFAPLKGGANLDQWANGAPPPTGQSWQNGNLNGNNSAYAEGKAVPFRLALEGLTPGDHFITIQYDFTAGGHKAYDFLASIEATELNALLNVCAVGGGGRSSLCGASTAGMPSPGVSTMTKPFPDDDQVVDGLTVTNAMSNDGAPRLLRIFGGTITDISTVSHAPNNDFNGNSTGEMLVKFTSTGSAVQLVWSGHLARSSYWNANNPPDGAGEVSGAPWHMRTNNLDGAGAANQDRSIQPSALVEDPTLTIVKTANPAGPVSAGTNIGFDIVVTNNGPGSANSVVVTDVLPTGFEWQVDGTKPECSIIAGTLTCNAGALAANATYTVRVTSPTDAADCKAVNNTAKAKASNTPEVSDDATVTVQCPSLSIDKTADQGTVSAGTSIGFVITVTNGAGAGTATGVSVTDNLPTTSGLNWQIDAANSNSGCSITNGVMTCNFGDIAPSTNKHVHITSVTTSASCTTINNTASYTTTNNGSGNDGASVTVQCPSLTISKVADQATVSAGTTIGFVITVSNGAGAGTATGVTVNDALPATSGLAWTIDAAGSDAGCGIAEGSLTCNFGSLAAGASKHVHITSPTTSASCSKIDNTASYTTTNNGTGQASASVTVQCAALDLSKQADAASVSAGSTIGFVLNVVNMGAGTATAVTVTDNLPTNTGLSWTIDATGSDAGCSIASNVLTCNFGSLGALASKHVHITSSTTAASCATINNTGNVTSTNTPGDQASASVTVQCPNLSIAKTADQGTVSAGTSIGFTITVTNAAGAGTATGVTVTDNLPATAGLNWLIDAANSSSGCSIGSGVLTCDFGTIAPNTNKHVHITSVTTSASCATINNIASYTTTNNGTGNDDASVIVQCPSLDLTKVADQATVSAGSQIGFVITVLNGAGAGTATGVTVTDVLPTTAGLNWTIDASNSDTGCSIASGTLTCNFGSLAGGASKHVHITSPTTAASCALINNTANVTTTNNGTDQASASVTVKCPDLSIDKTADQGTVSAGTAIGFVISVANASGAGTATGVVITDNLPTTAGLNWSIDAAGTDAPNCSIAAGVLTCNVGTLAPNTSKHVHITSPTTSASCTTINNTASYSSGNDGTGNDAASVLVQCPSLTIDKTADQGTVSAGTSIGFVITVSNSAGGGTATGVQITDNLPTTPGLNWQIDGAGTDAPNCSITAGVLTCNVGTLAAGASRHVHITSVTTSASCATINNTANYTTTNDGTGNDAASVLVQCPNLGIDKTADQGTVSAGTSIGFVITVSNGAGAGTATGVTITDNLPTTSGLNWSIDAGGTDAPNCSITAGVLTCNVGTLAPNTSKHVHITSPTTSASCTTINNTASYTTTNNGSGNDAATVVVQCPSLRVEKLPVAGSVAPGGTATFTIKVINDGPGTAVNVHLADTLPAGLTWTTPANNCTVTPYKGAGLNRVLDCPKAGGNAITLVKDAFFTVTVSASIPSTFTQNPPSGAGTPLEIDGDLTDGAAAGSDWNALGLNCNTGVGCKVDIPTGSDDDSFGEGTKEDDITPTIVTGSIPNNKSDLRRFYIAKERFLTHDHLYFAWARVQAPNGTTNMDIELNKLAPVPPAVLAVRSAGDILVKYDLAQGGTNPVLGFHRWVATGAKSLCEAANATPCWGKLQSLAGNANVAAAINTGSVADNIPPAQTLDALTFGEARIDLQGAQIFPEGQCTSFGSAYLKSRSSDSFTSAVKDFIRPIPINLSNCTPVDLKNTAFAQATNYQANAWVSSAEAKITVQLAVASFRFDTMSGRQLAWTAGRGDSAVSSPAVPVSPIETQSGSGEGRRRSARNQPNVPGLVAADAGQGRWRPISNLRRAV